MTVAIPFSISLRREFVDNALNVLDNIADAKQDFATPDKFLNNGTGINFIDIEKNQGSAYSIANYPDKLVNYICEIRGSYRSCDIGYGSSPPKVKKPYADIFTTGPAMYSIWDPNTKHRYPDGCKVFSDLWFSVFDENGNPLMREVFETCHSEVTVTRQRWLAIIQGENLYPGLSLYAAKNHQRSDPILVAKRDYVLLVTLDENLLGNAASMKFEYKQ